MNSHEFDTTSPIIIVGPGRSGTTRLNACLEAHPDVFMIGETEFLLPRLWKTYFEGPANAILRRLCRIHRDSHPEWRELPMLAFWNTVLNGDAEQAKLATAPLETAELTRLKRAFGAFVAEIHIPPSLRRARWGFKEIWSGGDAFDYDWELYRAAYPNALFIQSLRHPLSYLRSIISHLSRPDPTEAEMTHELGQWVSMVRHAQKLRETGRYLEFKMEDFDHEVPRILAFLGLSHDPACIEAAALKYIPSPRRSLDVPSGIWKKVPGLQELAEEIGYKLK